jgi:hypothetical protein
MGSLGMSERCLFAKVSESADWSERSERKEVDSLGFHHCRAFLLALLRGLRPA